MRDLQFRAYIKDIKKIVDVYDIDFLQETISFMNPCDTKYTCKKFNEIEFMQYTGLTDKNGTEIFEGDIVRINGWWDVSGPAGYEKNMTVVKYDNEVCGFTPMCNYDTDCGVFHSAEECEVIGNVFDNPELLEGV